MFVPQPLSAASSVLNGQMHLKSIDSNPVSNNFELALVTEQITRKNELIVQKVTLNPKDPDPYDDIEPIVFEISDILDFLSVNLGSIFKSHAWIIGETAESILSGLDHSRIEICFYLKGNDFSQIKKALSHYFGTKIPKITETLINQKFLYNFQEKETIYTITLGNLEISFTNKGLDGFHVSFPKDTNTFHTIIHAKHSDSSVHLQSLMKKHHLIPDLSLLKDAFWHITKYMTRGFNIESGNTLTLKQVSEIATKQLEIAFPEDGFMFGAFQEMIVMNIERQSPSLFGKSIHVLNLITFLLLNESEKSYPYIREIALAWLNKFVTKTHSAEIPLLEPLALLLKENPSHAKDLISIVKGLYLYKFLQNNTSLPFTTFYLPFLHHHREYFLFLQQSALDTLLECLYSWKRMEKIHKTKLFLKLGFGLKGEFADLTSAYRNEIITKLLKYPLCSTSVQFYQFIRGEVSQIHNDIVALSKTALAPKTPENSPPLVSVQNAIEITSTEKATVSKISLVSQPAINQPLPEVIPTVHLKQIQKIEDPLRDLSFQNPHLNELILALHSNLEDISKALSNLLEKKQYLPSSLPLLTVKLNSKIFSAIDNSILPPVIQQLIIKTTTFYLLSNIPSSEKESLVLSYANKLNAKPLFEFISNVAQFDVNLAKKILNQTKKKLVKEDTAVLHTRFQTLKSEKLFQNFSSAAVSYLKPNDRDYFSPLKNWFDRFPSFFEELQTYLETDKPSLSSIQRLIDSISNLPKDEGLSSEIFSEICLKIIENALNHLSNDKLALKSILEFTQIAFDHHLINSNSLEKNITAICKALGKISFAESPPLLIATYEFLFKFKSPNTLSLQSRIYQAAGRASEILAKDLDNKNVELLAKCLHIAFKSSNSASKIADPLASFWKFAIDSKNGYWLRIGYELGLLSFKANISKDYPLFIQLGAQLCQIEPTQLEEGLKNPYYRQLGLHLFAQILAVSKEQNISRGIQQVLLQASFDCLMSQTKNEKKAAAVLDYLKLLSTIHPTNVELESLLKMQIDFRKTLSKFVTLFVTFVFHLDKDLGCQFARNSLLKSRIRDGDFEEIQHLDFYSQPENVTVESLSEKIDVWNNSLKLSEIQVKDSRWAVRIKDTLALIKILTEHQPTALGERITKITKILILAFKKVNDQNEKWKSETSNTIGKTLAQAVLILNKKGKIPSSNQILGNARRCGLVNTETEKEIFHSMLKQFLEKEPSEAGMKEFIAFSRDPQNRKYPLPIIQTGCLLIQKYALTNNFRLLNSGFSCFNALFEFPKEIWLKEIDQALASLISFKTKTEDEETQQNTWFENFLEKLVSDFLPSWNKLKADFSQDDPLIADDQFDHFLQAMVSSGKLWKYPKISNGMNAFALFPDVQKHLYKFVLKIAATSTNRELYKWIDTEIKEVKDLQDGLNLFSHIDGLFKESPSPEQAKEFYYTLKKFQAPVEETHLIKFFKLHISLAFQSKDLKIIGEVLQHGANVSRLHMPCWEKIVEFFNSLHSNPPRPIPKKEIIKKMITSKDEFISQMACAVLIFYFNTQYFDRNSEHELNALFVSACRTLILCKNPHLFNSLFISVFKFFGESDYQRRIENCKPIVDAYLDTVLRITQTHNLVPDIRMLAAILNTCGKIFPKTSKVVFHTFNLALSSPEENILNKLLNLKQWAYKVQIIPKGKRHDTENEALPPEIFYHRSQVEKNSILISLALDKLPSSIRHLGYFLQMVDFACNCSTEKTYFLATFESVFKALISFEFQKPEEDEFHKVLEAFASILSSLLNDLLDPDFAKEVLKTVEKNLIDLALQKIFVQFFCDLTKASFNNQDEVVAEITRVRKEKTFLLWIDQLFSPINISSDELFKKIAEIPFDQIHKINTHTSSPIPRYYQLLMVILSTKALEGELKALDNLKGLIPVDDKLRKQYPFLTSFYGLQQIFLKHRISKSFLENMNQTLMKLHPKFFEAYLKLR